MKRILLVALLIAAPALADNPGTPRVQGVPNAFPVSTRSVPTSTTNSSSVISVTTAATAVIAAFATRVGGQIQNQSTSAVFCGFTSGVTTSAYAFILKAATGAADGTGGPANLQPGYTGAIWCIVASGTATVSESDF